MRSSASQSAGVSVPQITDVSVVETWPLKWRVDGNVMTLGRPDRSIFVQVPKIVEPIIVGVQGGLTPRRISQSLRETQGVTVDVTKFLGSLAAKGFINRVDGHSYPSPALLRPAFQWLKPRYVSFIASRWFATVWVFVAFALISAGVIAGSIRLKAADYFIVASPTLNVLINTLGPGLLMVCHEAAHILMARAYGQPGRIRLSSRLVFLVAESDVSSIRLATRSGRVKTYLAGMAWDCMVLGILSTAYWVVHGTGRRVFAAFILFITSGLLIQFACFMRSDMYFVLQDLCGRPNLFPEAVDAWKVKLTHWHQVTWRHVALPVRRYAWFIILGSGGVLTWFGLVGIPVAWRLFGASAHLVIRGIAQRDIASFADGAIVLIVEGGIYAFLVVRWARIIRVSFRDVHRRRRGVTL